MPLMSGCTVTHLHTHTETLHSLYKYCIWLKDLHFQYGLSSGHLHIGEIAAQYEVRYTNLDTRHFSYGAESRL